MSGGGGQTTTTSNNLDPSVKQFYDQGFGFASSLMGNDYSFAPFPSYVPASPTTNYALNQTQNTALQGSPIPQWGESAIQQMLGSTNNWLANPANQHLVPFASGQYLGANPFLDAQFNIGKEQVQNAVNSQFSGAGRYGSGAHQDVTQKGLNELANSIYGGAYANDRSQQLQGALGLQEGYANALGEASKALALAPQTMDLRYQDIDKLFKLGQVDEFYGQQQLDDLLARWTHPQDAPWNVAQNFMGLIAGLPVGSTSTSTTKGSSNPFSSILGAVSGIGSLFSAFSDEEFKTNRQPTDDDEVLDYFRNSPTDTYEYSDDSPFPGHHSVGPMAQDIPFSEEGENGLTIPMPKMQGMLHAGMRAIINKLDQIESSFKSNRKEMAYA